MNTQSYTIQGMTCGHCAASVTREVGGVAGVDGISVNVATGTLTVTSDGSVDAEIAAAVDEAGYTFVGRQ